MQRFRNPCLFQCRKTFLVRLEHVVSSIEVYLSSWRLSPFRNSCPFHNGSYLETRLGKPTAIHPIADIYVSLSVYRQDVAPCQTPIGKLLRAKMRAGPLGMNIQRSDNHKASRGICIYNFISLHDA